jgi:hypothetical protein
LGFCLKSALDAAKSEGVLAGDIVEPIVASRRASVYSFLLLKVEVAA